MSSTSPIRIRGVAIAVDTVQEDRDVAIDDVAVLQHAVVGDAVADDLVHRGAQRLREALVMQRARIAAVRDARFVTDVVELVGGDADANRVFELDQYLGTRRRPAARMRSANSSGGTAGTSAGASGAYGGRGISDGTGRSVKGARPHGPPARSVVARRGRGPPPGQLLLLRRLLTTRPCRRVDHGGRGHLEVFPQCFWATCGASASSSAASIDGEPRVACSRRWERARDASASGDGPSPRCTRAGRPNTARGTSRGRACRVRGPRDRSDEGRIVLDRARRRHRRGRRRTADRRRARTRRSRP